MEGGLRGMKREVEVSSREANRDEEGSLLYYRKEGKESRENIDCLLT